MSSNAAFKHTMAKHFSVEWLSQSFYSPVSCTNTSDFDDRIHSKNENDTSDANDRRHMTSNTDLSIVPNMIDLMHTDTDNGQEATALPVSPSNSCGYTSSSESEVGDHGEGESGSNRRMRTKFTSDQIFRLEKTFNKHKYLGATQRRKIAEKLHLSETQVKTWFQNRRMKLKRDVQDMRSEYLAPSLLPSLVFPTTAAFQHRGFSGQLLAFPSAAPHVYPHSMQSVPAQQLQPQPPVVHPMMLASCYY